MIFIKNKEYYYKIELKMITISITYFLLTLKFAKGYNLLLNRHILCIDSRIYSTEDFKSQNISIDMGSLNNDMFDLEFGQNFANNTSSSSK